MKNNEGQYYRNLTAIGILSLAFALLPIFMIGCSTEPSKNDSSNLLDSPKALFDDEKYEEAYQKFNELAIGDELKNYPEIQAEAAFGAANSLRRLGRYDEAIDLYNNFITQFPDSQWVENSLYLIGYSNFYYLSNYAACRDALGTLLDKYPNSIRFKEDSQRLIEESFLADAEAFFHKEKYEEAYNEFNRLATSEELKNYPKVQAEAAFRAAHSLQMLRKYDEAIDLYNNFIPQFPDSHRVENALYARGLCYYDLQNYENARSSFTACLDRFPNSQFKDNLQKNIMKSFLEEAEALANDGKYEEAYKEFNKLISSDKFKNYPELRAEAMFRTAHSLQMLGKYNEAVDLYNNFMPQFPDSHRVENALYARGLCYYDLQNYEDARSSFTACLDRFPNSQFKDDAAYYIARSFSKEAERKEKKVSEAQRQSLNNLAAAYNDEKLIDYDKALNRYANFIEQFPESQHISNAYLGQGNIYFNRDKYDIARTKYEAALQSADDVNRQAEIQFKIGQTYYKQDQSENAIAAYELLLEKYPNSDFVGDAKYWIAHSHFLMGSWDDAAVAYKRVIDEHQEAKSDIPTCLYQIGEAHHELATKHQEDGETEKATENFEKALNHYQKILDEFPTNEFAPFALYGVMSSLNALKREDELERFVLKHSFRSSIHISEPPSDIDLIGLSYFRIALKEEHLKNYNEALESYQKAISLTKTALIKAQSYYRRGVTYQNKLDSPNKEKAVTAFQTLISEYGNSENSSVISMVADAHMRLSELLGKSIPEEEKRDLIDQRALGSTVLLVMKDSSGQHRGSGSGFFVAPGLIVTNYHVVSKAAGGYAELVVENMTHEEKTKFDIQGYTAVNKERDLVILKVSGISPPELPLGNSEDVGRNHPVYAVGTPLGKGHLTGTISPGSISKIRKDAEGNQYWLQHNALIYPGNSGGPLLNRDGEVIGINVGTEGFQDKRFGLDRQYAYGLHYAIPSKDLSELLKEVSRLKPLRLIEFSPASHAVQ